MTNSQLINLLNEMTLDEKDCIIAIEPNQTERVLGIRFKTIPAYNVNKTFHPKENGWLGYIIEIDGIKYYIAGDTDANEDNKKVKCDVAFVPVGGTYTMDSREAAQFMKPKKGMISIYEKSYFSH